MPVLFKVMRCAFHYNSSEADQMRNLHYTAYDSIPKVEIAGLVFYELNDLLTIGLSKTKEGKLVRLKAGYNMELCKVSRTNSLYLVRLTELEMQTLENLKIEHLALENVKAEIENQVGKLLKTKKEYENSISNLKKVFKS